MSGDQLFDPVWQAILRLERLGFCVLALTCDGASPNRRLWKLHSQTDEMIYKVPNPYATDRQLYFISDPPHLLTLRPAHATIVVISTRNQTNSHSFNPTRPRIKVFIYYYSPLNSV